MKIKLPPLQSDNSRLKTNVKNKMDFIWNLTQNLSGNKNGFQRRIYYDLKCIGLFIDKRQ
jgi:hypothetical protein